jgi:hypothetical protein
MAIAQHTLRQAASHGRQLLAKSVTEARQIGVKTAFLCHSHLDAELAKGLVNLLRQFGWEVYVDWADSSMPPEPNRETARKIKDRIQGANYFLFLATAHSTVSRWCPWEIGFADGVKSYEAIFIIPTRDSSNTHYGNEYLQIYQRIDETGDINLGAWLPGETNGIYVSAIR